MMNNVPKKLIIVLLSASLMACVASNESSQVASPAVNQTVAEIYVPDVTPSAASTSITMETIMADPDWLGREPQQSYWSDDSKSVFYSRKQQGGPLHEFWHRPLTGQDNGHLLPVPKLHEYQYQQRVLNKKRNKAAWTFEGNIFVKDLVSGELRQLSRDGAQASKLQFLSDGRLAFQRGDGYYAIKLDTGMMDLLASWKFAETPKALLDPKDYIAKQQIDLIQFVAKHRADKQSRFDYRQQLQSQNASLAPKPYYLPEKHETVESSLSPDGHYLLLSEHEVLSDRADGDIMPNYINEDGRIQSEEVRQRVADAKSKKQNLWLFDLQSGQQYPLSFQSLPGYNDDVLAQVKRENAKAKGEDYQTNRLPRDIGLMQDWYWSQSAIQWHQDGSQVAIMLEAWDNKDRWLATVDLKQKSLVNQHRLHDDAWINYKFNSFGWLQTSHTLYFLSEHTGFAQLYQKPLNGKVQAVTKGNYEVDDITLSQDDKFIYFKANKKHPGIYEVYRVELASGNVEALTDLNGMTDYQLSPDESKLLLSHSKVTMPPELYVHDLSVAADARRLTHTVSEAFLAMPWIAPQIVPVKSSHTTQPIYSRVYTPKDVQEGEKRKAVIFSHGAGYLQNSHLGWSGYFREFMFHSLLVQQGYVVMDMDYRASAGYGRDWRTAIYRQMGTPETQDLRDGVNWLVDNVNVDAGRIGTYGGSYGGFMTFMALFTAPNLFQSGAALRPVSDWAHYNHGYTSNILNTPDVDPIAYERSSPIYFAEGLQKPLLINAPMVDNNVFFQDTVRLVQRLIELEKQDFETAIYPVEPHGFRQASSWLNEYRRIYKLFETTL
jgi:dipeptidyl aminopeptidase/acylaminoacyl peptidase